MADKVSLEDMRNILGINKGAQPKEKLGQAKVDEDGKVEIYDTTIEALAERLIEEAQDDLKPAITETIARVTAQDVGKLAVDLFEKFENTKSDVLALAESVRPIEIKTQKKTKKIKGVYHNQFENLLKIVGTGQAVLMVGPAGTGKTHGAQMVADALDLKFYSISVGSQTSKSDLIGYLDATHTYVSTQFREAYEKGGLFLLDEADAGNSNVLILLNAALSNGYMAFPDGMIKAHEDFRMIATANTFGHGANRQYVGRNQLDAATLDRFACLIWDIDDKVEADMAGPTAEGKKWLSVVRAVRKRAIEDLELRVVVSPRATQRGVTLLNAGLSFEDTLQIALIANMPAGEREELKALAETAWAKK